MTDFMQRDAHASRLVTLHLTQFELRQVIHALGCLARPQDVYLIRCLREQVRG